MYFFKFNFTSSLYVLTFVLLLHKPVFGADPISQICEKSGNLTNFTTNDPYETNLKKLMGDLSYKTPPSGFSFSSVGVRQYQTYGLALCRGDVTDIDCGACVIEASSKIRKYCPNNKGAITWYENCQVKYSPSNFFGQIDKQNVIYAWSNKNVSDPTSFNPKVRKLFKELANQAYENPKMYMTGTVKLDKSRNLYGLVQCTRDLSGIDCNKCLNDAIKQQSDCCDGKQGGRVMTGNCNFI